MAAKYPQLVSWTWCTSGNGEPGVGRGSSNPERSAGVGDPSWADRRQPVVGSDGFPWVSDTDRWAVGGETHLIRHEALRRELNLSADGAAADSEGYLVAAAFERWGEDAVMHLAGSYRLWAWDRLESRLVLATSAGGFVPLYYHRNRDRILVAVRAPALLAQPGVPRRVNLPRLVDRFVDRYESVRETALAEIEFLPPGTLMIVNADGRSERRTWWTLSDAQAWTKAPPRDVLPEFRALFAEVVGDYLTACGMPAVYCSGGLDSTAVTAVAAVQLAAAGGVLHTYTSVPHPDWPAIPEIEDESSLVRQLAHLHRNIKPAFVAIDGDIFLDHLPELFAAAAAPVRNVNNLGWLRATDRLMVTAGVTQPLCGAMGNPTISLQGRLLPDLWRVRKFSMIGKEFGLAPIWACRELFSTARPHLPDWFLRILGRGPNHVAPQWKPRIALQPKAAAAWGLDRKDRAWQGGLSLSEARHLMWASFANVGLSPTDALLPWADPTGDQRIWEFCAALPPTEFTHGGQTRRLIRRAMEGLVPDVIRLAPKQGRQGVDAPLHLSRRREDLREAIEFVARDSTCAELLDIPALRRWATEDLRRSPAELREFSSIPYERALSLGLYLRWINEGLPALPGARPPRPPIVEYG